MLITNHMTCMHASVAAACMHQTSNIKGDQKISTRLFFRLSASACKNKSSVLGGTSNEQYQMKLFLTIRKFQVILIDIRKFHAFVLLFCRLMNL